MATKSLQPDDRIAHYRVIRALGAGGMGEVYLAHDDTLERKVALKVLPPMHREDERLKRFVLEARSASSLSHPNIITVYEIGSDVVRSADGTGSAEPVHYIAMELVSGDTLTDVIHDGKADMPTLLGYLAQVADGLAKAHASGIVHRDLKPGNIMISADGYAKVLDFGLAKLVEAAPAADAASLQAATRQALTVEGMIVGTIGYMAPEQILGRAVDHRADIFSFGCILYEAATRRRPFTADSQFETLQKIISQDPLPIEAVSGTVPADLRSLVLRCLAKSPDQRISSMKDVGAELRRIAAAHPSLPMAPGVDDATVYAAPIPQGLGAGGSSSRAEPGTASTNVIPVPSTVLLPPAAQASRRRLPVPAIAAALVVLLAAGGAFYFFKSRGASSLSEEAIDRMQVTSVLTNPDLQRIALSPDGRFAAYITYVKARWALRVRQLSTASEAEIGKPQESPITGISFTPDGDMLYFVARDPDSPNYGALFKVPSLGGDPQKVMFDIDTEATFSPDGRRIAFMREDPQTKQTKLLIQDLTALTTPPQVLATVTAEQDVPIDKPRWSPDGQEIAVVSTAGAHPDVVVFDVKSGKQATVGSWEGPRIDSVAWMGQDGLVVAGAATPGLFQLWHLAYPGGERRRLTNDQNQYAEISTSRDGRIIAARRTLRPVQMWQVPTGGTSDQMAPARLGSSTAGPEPLSSIESDTDRTIVFIAPRDNVSTIWVVSPDGSSRKPLSPEGMAVLAQKFIPGQHATAFTGYGADFIGHIYRIGLDGGLPSQLTTGSGENLLGVTPDGRYLLYNTTQAPRTLMRMASAGGGGTALVTDYIDGLTFAKDSALISYNRLQTIGQRTVPVRVVASINGGAAVATIQPPPRASDYQFTPDAGALTYVDATSAVMRVPLDGGTPAKLFDMTDARIDVHRWVDAKTMLLRVFSPARSTSNLWRWTAGMPRPLPLTNFPSGLIFDFVPSPDGRTMYFTQGSFLRELVLIKGLK